VRMCMWMYTGDSSPSVRPSVRPVDDSLFSGLLTGGMYRCSVRGGSLAHVHIREAKNSRRRRSVAPLASDLSSTLFLVPTLLKAWPFYSLVTVSNLFAKQSPAVATTRGRGHRHRRRVSPKVLLVSLSPPPLSPCPTPPTPLSDSFDRGACLLPLRCKLLYALHYV
jgi:hypothetical protein